MSGLGSFWPAGCHFRISSKVKIQWQPIYFHVRTQIFTYSLVSRKMVLELKIKVKLFSSVWVSDAVRHTQNFWGAREKGNFTSNQIYWELPLYWIFKEKSFDKAIVALEILYKSSVPLQLYSNKSTSTEIRMDKRIRHIVYLSISVLLQPPGMKMNVPYAISRLKPGYMDVSQDWKKIKQHWNTVGSNWIDWKGLFWVTVWDGRFVFRVTARPRDAPCRLNNSPGKDLFPWPDKHNHLFQLKRSWQVSCPLAMCRLSSWCWALYLKLPQWLFSCKSYCWMLLSDKAGLHETSWV